MMPHYPTRRGWVRWHNIMNGRGLSLYTLDGLWKSFAENSAKQRVYPIPNTPCICGNDVHCFLQPESPAQNSVVNAQLKLVKVTGLCDGLFVQRGPDRPFPAHSTLFPAT